MLHTYLLPIYFYYSFSQISLVRMISDKKMILGLISAVVDKAKKLKPIQHHYNDGEPIEKTPFYESKAWEMYVLSYYIFTQFFFLEKKL